MIDTNIGISGIQNEIHDDYTVTGHGGERYTVKLFLFARTLFSRKFARP